MRCSVNQIKITKNTEYKIQHNIVNNNIYVIRCSDLIVLILHLIHICYKAYPFSAFI